MKRESLFAGVEGESQALAVAALPHLIPLAVLTMFPFWVCRVRVDGLKGCWTMRRRV